MPELTQEEFDALLQFVMSGAFATSSTPSTGLNLYQDILSQILSNEDAAIISNQIWEPYQVYTPFNPAGLTNTIDTYIQNGDPVWSTVAAGIKANKYTRADAINYVANELASSLDTYSSNILTEQDVKDEIDKMFEEKKNYDLAEAQYIKDAEEFNRTNAYGSRNLPQATDVWGLEAGPGVVPAPISEVSQRQIDFANEMQRQIDESGLESFVAGKDDATSARMVALAKQMVKEKGLLREDDRLRAMQGAGKEETSQESPSKAQLISAEEGGMFAPTISSAAAANPPTGPGSRTVLPVGNTAARDRMNYSEVPLAIKMLANFEPISNFFGMKMPSLDNAKFNPQLASVASQAKGDVNRRYAPQENQLNSWKGRRDEALYHLDIFRNADLANTISKGISPTQYATNERAALAQALMSALLSFNGPKK